MSISQQYSNVIFNVALSLTSSCSRCVQKQWWGWAGWGWRQILPPHRRNAKLGDRVGRTMTHIILIYVREVRTRQVVNHKPALVLCLYQHQGYCSHKKVKLNTQDLWTNNSQLCVNLGSVFRSLLPSSQTEGEVTLSCPQASILNNFSVSKRKWRNNREDELSEDVAQLSFLKQESHNWNQQMLLLCHTSNFLHFSIVDLNPYLPSIHFL